MKHANILIWCARKHFHLPKSRTFLNGFPTIDVLSLRTPKVPEHVLCVNIDAIVYKVSMQQEMIYFLLLRNVNCREILMVGVKITGSSSSIRHFHSYGHLNRFI